MKSRPEVPPAIAGGNVYALALQPDGKLIAAGDFNHDGKTDLLWRKASNGNVAVWLMDGITMIGNPTASRPRAPHETTTG